MPTLKTSVTPSGFTSCSASRKGKQPADGPPRGLALNQRQYIIRIWLHLLWQALSITREQLKQLYKKCQHEITPERIKQCSCAALKELEHIASHSKGDTHPVTSQHHMQTITCACSLTQSVEFLQRQNGHTVVIKQIREQTYLRLSFNFSSENP